MTTIIIADDHRLMRSAVRLFLTVEPEFELVGEAVDGLEADALAMQLQPDIAIIDIHMPGIDGVQLLHKLHEHSPGTRCLLISAYNDSALLPAAMAAGAWGFLTKRSIENCLIEAVHAIAQGRRYVEGGLAATTFSAEPEPALRASMTADELSDDERMLLRLLAGGLTTGQIAERMCISALGVNGLREQLSHKLGLRSRLDLVRYARQEAQVV